jgi:hypothetical protein
VRGTPGSGKSVLAILLQEYISNQEPNTRVARVPTWKEESEMRKSGGWRKWLSERWTDEDDSDDVLIVDDAQSSYWDHSFWFYTLKLMMDRTRYRIITFASYGSNTGSNPLAALATPFYAPPYQFIGLYSIESAEDKIQLCLSKEEYNDFVYIVFPNSHFDSSLLNSIYDLTNGHVGACRDILDVITEHEVSRRTLNFPMNLIPDYPSVISELLSRFCQ